MHRSVCLSVCELRTSDPGRGQVQSLCLHLTPELALLLLFLSTSQIGLVVLKVLLFDNSGEFHLLLSL